MTAWRSASGLANSHGKNQKPRYDTSLFHGIHAQTRVNNGLEFSLRLQAKLGNSHGANQKPQYDTSLLQRTHAQHDE